MSTSTAAIAALGSVFVQADVLNLRAEPAGASALVTRVRINTSLEVVERSGGWTRVRIPNRPPEHDVSGWVRDDYVAERPVTATDAELRASETSGEEALRWASRAAAARPDDLALWKLVAERAEEVGDAGAAALARDWLDEDATVWVARCAAGRAELLGSWTTDGFRGVDLAPAAALKLAVDIAPLPWFSARFAIDEGREETGTRFVAPFVTTTVNEETTSPWAPGESTGQDEDLVVLGPCDQDAILATRPIAPVHEDAVALPETLRLVQAVAGQITEPVSGVTVDVPIRGRGLRQVRVQVPYEHRDCGEVHPWPRTAWSWGLTDVEGRLVAGLTTFGNDRVLTHVDGPSPWYAVRRGGETSWLSAFGFVGGTFETVTIVTVPPVGEVDHDTLFVRHWGC